MYSGTMSTGVKETSSGQNNPVVSTLAWELEDGYGTPKDEEETRPGFSISHLSALTSRLSESKAEKIFFVQKLSKYGF